MKIVTEIDNIKSQGTSSIMLTFTLSFHNVFVYECVCICMYIYEHKENMRLRGNEAAKKKAE